MSFRTLTTSLLLIAVCCISRPLPAQQEGGAQQAGPVSENGQIGYFLGVSMGQQMRGSLLKQSDIDLEALKAGFADGIAGNEPKLTDEQLQATQAKLQQILQQRRNEQAAADAAKGQEFLAANAKQEGVKQLPGGLQYKVLKSGDGESPSATDTVRVHYTGKLVNGQVFDSSVQRGEPAQFPVNGVISGWTTALQKMQVGDKWMLYIPPDLAYGEEGRPPAIGPNEVLIFEVELLDIVE